MAVSKQYDFYFGQKNASVEELDAMVVGKPDFVLAQPYGKPDDDQSTPAWRSVLSPDVLVDGWPGSGIEGIPDVFDKGMEVAKIHGKDNMFCYKDRIYEPAGDPMGKIAGFSAWKWCTWSQFNERRLDFGSGLCRLYAKLMGGDENQRIKERWTFSLFAYNVGLLVFLRL
jgi:hypothetical protein